MRVRQRVGVRASACGCACVSVWVCVRQRVGVRACGCTIYNFFTITTLFMGEHIIIKCAGFAVRGKCIVKICIVALGLSQVTLTCYTLAYLSIVQSKQAVPRVTSFSSGRNSGAAFIQLKCVITWSKWLAALCRHGWLHLGWATRSMYNF